MSKNVDGHHSSTSTAACTAAVLTPPQDSNSFDIGDSPFAGMGSVGYIMYLSENDQQKSETEDEQQSSTGAAAAFKQRPDHSFSNSFISSDGGISGLSIGTATEHQHERSLKLQIGASTTMLQSDATIMQRTTCMPKLLQLEQHCPQIEKQQKQFALADREGHIEILDTKHCPCCKKDTRHTIKEFSLHCRVKGNINKTYKSMTCKKCQTEWSRCPNGKSVHLGDSGTQLVWDRLTSAHTSEKVWEIECGTCTGERKRRKEQKNKQTCNGKIPKLAKLTTKWTRCNYCKALYKKGKGKKGVHVRNACRIRPNRHTQVHSSPAAASPRARTPPPVRSTLCRPLAYGMPLSTHHHPLSVVELNKLSFVELNKLIEDLVDTKRFTTLPEKLRKRIVAQCDICNVRGD